MSNGAIPCLVAHRGARTLLARIVRDSLAASVERRSVARYGLRLVIFAVKIESQYSEHVHFV